MTSLNFSFCLFYYSVDDVISINIGFGVLSTDVDSHLNSIDVYNLMIYISSFRLSGVSNLRVTTPWKTTRTMRRHTPVTWPLPKPRHRWCQDAPSNNNNNITIQLLLLLLLAVVVLHLLLLLPAAAAAVVMALVERVRLLSKVFTAPRVVTWLCCIPATTRRPWPRPGVV